MIETRELANVIDDVAVEAGAAVRDEPVTLCVSERQRRVASQSVGENGNEIGQPVMLAKAHLNRGDGVIQDGGDDRWIADYSGFPACIGDQAPVKGPIRIQTR